MSDLLYTPQQQGYLMRTIKTRRFFPTSRLNALVQGSGKTERLHAVAVEGVAALSERTGETSFFGRLDNGAVRVLAVHEGTHALRYVLQVDERIALHASAMGKAVLSMLPAEEASALLLAKPLRPVASRTKTDPAAIERDVAACRKTHIASVDSEGTDGVTAYAIAGIIGIEPVALSCAGPTDRLQANAAGYQKVLREIAGALFG